MKKLTIVLLILTMLACSFALVGCKKTDDSDGFVGATSQSVFDSVEDAVKGFLEEEISGEAFAAVYVGYSKTSDLSQKEIDKLAIDDEYKEGIVGVEKGEVEYKEQANGDTASVVQLASETNKRSVYVIKYQAKYRYYTPPVLEGESISKSYFNSVFDMKNFLNCTLEMNIGEEYKYLCKISEDVIYIILEQSKQMNEVNEGIYLFNIDDYLVGYSNNYDGKENITLGGKLTLKEFLTFMFEDNNNTLRERVGSEFYFYYAFFLSILFLPAFGGRDSSYFVKTKTGYAMKEKYKNYPEENVYINEKNGKVTDAFIKAFVDGGSYEYLSFSYKYSNYGTTKVDIPAEVKAAVDEYIKNNQ